MNDFMGQVAGTVVGRWYVTIFGITFAVLAIRHMGWRRTILYTAGALVVGGLAENGSVLWGVPYTGYSFNPDLRGEELHLGSVPLMVSLSYTFMAYFAFGAARLVVGGPHRTRSRTPVLEYLVAVMLAVWIIWAIDPISRLGEHFFLGSLFAYDGPGFWFGLPLGSQIGFTVTQGVLIGFLTYLMRDERPTPVASVWKHPQFGALGGIIGQLLFMTSTAFWVARTVDDPEVAVTADALAGSAFIMGIPVVLMTAVHWRSLSLSESREQADRLELDELVEPLGAVLTPEATGLEPSER
ncbi:MAG: carotenoid biosynthesis protein [Actinobacteria bacterium]|nr:carotenoid biosynthesis protein [Actinomycetota bacterium]